jgi:hypothetical protein
MKCSRLRRSCRLDYDFDLDAPDPVLWLHLLQQWFGHDFNCIRLLRQWMGLMLTQDTSYQRLR